MATNTVVVSELNYGVTVDEANNITVELATPSVGQVGYTGSAGAGYTGSRGETGYVGSGAVEDGIVRIKVWASADSITRGMVVQAIGGYDTPGGVISATPASFGTYDPLFYPVLGVAEHDIPSGENGFVVVHGSIDNIDTTAAAGYPPYPSTIVVDPTGYGQVTDLTAAIKPMVIVGLIQKHNSVNGSIFINVDASRASRLYELRDVSSTYPTDGQGLKWNNTSAQWEAADNPGYTGSKGDTGASGYTGSKGADGIIGYNGSIGYTGSAGIQGSAGYVGSRGSDGYVGSQGPIGYTGSIPALVDNINFNVAAGFVGSMPGQMYWDGEATLNVTMENGVTLQLGQESYVYGKATEIINNGDVVMFAGVQGDHALFARCTDVINTNPTLIVGVATQAFIANQFGYVTNFGKVRDLNTIAYAPGTLLYVDPDVVGGLTSVQPAAPKAVIQVAAVLRQHANAGILLVRVTANHTINQLQDVNVDAATPGQVLGYNGSVWLGTTVSAGFTGSAGYVGSAGADGSTGYVGSKGDAGASGYVGSQGYSGSVGYVGSQGVIGYTGSGATPTVSAPSYSGTVVADVSGDVNVVRITLTGNLVLGFTGGTDGQKFIVELTQDGVGSRTLTYDASVVFGTDITGTTLSTTANKTDRIGFIYNSGTGKYSVIAFAKGY